MVTPGLKLSYAMIFITYLLPRGLSRCVRLPSAAPARCAQRRAPSSALPLALHTLALAVAAAAGTRHGLARRASCNIAHSAYNFSSISCKLKSFHVGYEQFEIAQDRWHLAAGVCRGLSAAQTHRGVAAPGNDAIGRQPRTRPAARNLRGRIVSAATVRGRADPAGPRARTQSRYDRAAHPGNLDGWRRLQSCIQLT